MVPEISAIVRAIQVRDDHSFEPETSVSREEWPAFIDSVRQALKLIDLSTTNEIKQAQSFLQESELADDLLYHELATRAKKLSETQNALKPFGRLSRQLDKRFQDVPNYVFVFYDISHGDLREAELLSR